MAEILIKATNATHPDPIKDARGCYKRGMPVVVMPDGHQWGAAEGLPNFVVLKLPGVSVDRVLQFIEQDETGEGESRVVNRRRLWKLFVDEIPLAARNKLATQGYLTIGAGGDYTWAQVRNYIRSLRDNSLAPSTI